MTSIPNIEQWAIPSDTEAELFVLDQQKRLLGLQEGRPDLCQFSSITEGCLRVHKEGKEGIVTSADLDRSEMGTLMNRGIEMVAHSHSDPHRRFASALESPAPVATYDEKIFEESSGAVFARLGELEKKVLGYDPRLKKILKLHFQESKQTKSILNTVGLKVTSTGTSFALMGEFLADGPDGVEVGWDVKETRFQKDLLWDEWALDLAKITVQSLGGRSLPTGAMSVILHPRVGAQFLSLVAQALSAEAVQWGRSFLKNCEGKNVAGAGVSLTDDPFIMGGIASGSFDDEGTAHEKVDLVNAGVLTNYFYDIRSGSRAGKKSNGHGIKPAMASPPKPGPTNFYLKPGSSSLEKMIHSENKIFFIREVMGLHTADPITGEFSLGASGLFYENGQISHPVRGVTVSGRISDLLKNIKSIGDLVEWHGNFGCPFVFVSPMMVAGTL